MRTKIVQSLYSRSCSKGHFYAHTHTVFHTHSAFSRKVKKKNIFNFLSPSCTRLAWYCTSTMLWCHFHLQDIVLSVRISGCMIGEKKTFYMWYNGLAFEHRYFDIIEPVSFVNKKREDFLFEFLIHFLNEKNKYIF